MASHEFTRREIIGVFTEESGADNAKKGVEYILRILNVNEYEANHEALKILTKSLCRLNSSLNERWQNAKRTRDKFESQNKNWLDSQFNVRKNKLFNN